MRADWTAYVQRMAAYGNNGVVVPLFLELVSLDRIPGVYRGTALGERHRVLRSHFRALFATAREAGLQVYLSTDMVPLTPPLAGYLQRRGHLVATDSALWRVYRAAFEELFQALPEVRGVVVRIGEAGALYNRPDWPYRSRHLVGTISGLQSMLRGLLPVFEEHERALILRSWSVGVGELGDLHTNPATYQQALGGITSPNLIVSTKFQDGDFFRPLAVNRTLLSGSHQRIVEFQARREFEGFAAFPNYVGSLHARALSAIRAANPNVTGSWIWTQTGGPLRAGPMSLYPLHGFWLWIDANTYVTSRLAEEPGKRPDELAAEWVRREISADPVVVKSLSDLLLQSSQVIELGYYIRQFAERRVTFAGYELPPLFWIMEWDMVGGWSTVWSSIYEVIHEELDDAVADGFTALAEVQRMRQLLEQARPALASQPELFRQIERSLAYESSLLGTLAWYRAGFSHYYRWLATGDRVSYRHWRKAGPEFRRWAKAHRTTFGSDLDFPAFEFSAGHRSVHLARRSTDTRWLARGLLVLVLGTLVARCSRRHWAAPASLLAPTAAVLGIFTVAVALFLSFTSVAVAAALTGVLVVFLLMLRFAAAGRRPEQNQIILVALAPILWVTIGLLAAMSVRGPHHLWFQLWTSAPMRLLGLAIGMGLPLWTLIALTLAARRWSGLGFPAAAGSVTLAFSTALLVLAWLSPGLEQMLGALDRPLGLAPMTYAVVVGVQTYTRLPAVESWYPAALCVLMMAGGVLRFRYGRAVS